MYSKICEMGAVQKTNSVWNAVQEKVSACVCVCVCVCTRARTNARRENWEGIFVNFASLCV